MISDETFCGRSDTLPENNEMHTMITITYQNEGRRSFYLSWAVSLKKVKFGFGNIIVTDWCNYNKKIKK